MQSLLAELTKDIQDQAGLVVNIFAGFALQRIAEDRAPNVLDFEDLIFTAILFILYIVVAAYLHRGTARLAKTNAGWANDIDYLLQLVRIGFVLYLTSLTFRVAGDEFANGSFGLVIIGLIVAAVLVENNRNARVLADRERFKGIVEWALDGPIKKEGTKLLDAEAQVYSKAQARSPFKLSGEPQFHVN